MIKKVLITLLISLNSLWAQEDFKHIEDICLKAKEGDKQALTELFKESLNKENKSLREYLVRVVTLLMLKTSSKSTSKYIQKVSSLYPDSKVFSFLEIPPIQQECTKCKGFGRKLLNCSKCKDGQCKNCKGQGAIIYGNGKSRRESACIQCKSTGNCKTCSGSSKIPVKCSVCRAKGSVFDKASLSIESTRAFNVLIQKAYELDGDSNTVVDRKILDKEKEIINHGNNWLTLHKSKEAEWLELEKKRLASVKKKKPVKNGPNYITTVEEELVESYEEGGSTSTLDHICLEIKEYLRAQELKSKQKFLIKVYGQFLSDVPTVHLVVSENFSKSDYDYKLRAADGFYKFSALRAQANGYQEIDFKLLTKDGSQFGGLNEIGFWINK